MYTTPIDTQQLQAFISVAQLGSFTKAAEALHITQPAISKRILMLERAFGMPLFDRMQKSVLLTEAGRQLLPRAQSLLDQTQDLLRFALTLQEGIHGRLNLACSHHIGLHRLPPYLRAFRAAHEQVDLQLHFDDSERAMKGVLTGDYDLAIVTVPDQVDEHLHSQILWRDPLHIVAPLDHGLVDAGPLHFDALVNWPAVLPEPDTHTYQILAHAFSQAPVDLDIAMHNNSLEMVKMLVQSGFGWSILPASMVDPSIAILPMRDALSRNLGVVMHRQRSNSNAAKAFIQHLASYPASTSSFD